MNQIFNHAPTHELQARDAAHHMHPFTAQGQLAEKGARVITAANGVFVYDSDGEKILDAMAGYGVLISVMAEKSLPMWRIVR